MVPETTLVKSTPRIEGPRINEEATASIRLHPGMGSSGIIFVRTDLPGEPSLTCDVNTVSAQPRWSALEGDGVLVQHTEHILAAVAGCGLDNVRIEMDCEHVPIVSGGSCHGFTQAILDAGLQNLSSPRRVFRLKKPVHMAAELDTPAGAQNVARAAGRYVLGVPADGFAASYLFDVPAIAGLPRGFAEFDSQRDVFTQALDQSRTYYLQVEADSVHDLLSSVRSEDIVLNAESSQSEVDEVARHKLVDFMGDLHLLGRPVLGRFAAFRTGHRFHHDLVRKLAFEDYLEVQVLADQEEVT